MSSILPTVRLEQGLPDQKPLYGEAEARAEAERCLYCADAPCIKACPTEIDIPTFIKKIASGNVRGAARTIFEQNMLGHSCARVCPVEVLCVGDCVYNGWEREPIAIGRLQRFATETATAGTISGGQPPLFTPAAKTGRKVALVGAGPASLACAAELALHGHQPVIFEQRGLPGGLNTSGIAPYKLQAEDSLHEVGWIEQLGVEIRDGVVVGQDLRGAQLLEEHDFVFLGVGLGADQKLGIHGEDGPGVHGATAWIEQMKLAGSDSEPVLGRVVIIGGGNTAIDVARECAGLGAAEVTLVYRRGLADMSGYAHELEAARAAGVRLLTDRVPLAIERSAAGVLQAIRLGRAVGGQPVAEPQSETTLPCDLVAVAIGQSKLHALAVEFPGVQLDRRGCLIADPATGVTGNPKVFSGGDCINGGKEVVNAVADGRNAAREMMRRWSP